MKKFYTLLTALFLWPVFTFAQNGDVCADAVAITDAGSYDVETLVGGGGTSGYDAAWYAYTPAESGTIDVNSCYGGSDTRLFFRGGTCASLTLIANNDDSCPFAADSTGSSFASSLSDLTVISGTTYYIEWDGRWSTDPFTFNLVFTPLPGPDSCEIATDVVPGQYYADVLEGDGGSQGYDAAWYTFTPAVDGFMDVSSCYGGSDTRLWIWSGDCDNLVAVDDTDDDCVFAVDSTGNAYAASLMMVPVVGGTTYYIEWDARWSNNAFWWTLNFAAPLETCALAEEVMAPSTTTNTGITGDQGSTWYYYYADLNGSINVTSCYGGSDTRLFIWEGDCDNLVAVADTDDDCIYATDSTGSSYAASLEGVNVTAGNTYYIQWTDQWSADGFDWSIEFSEEQTVYPVNDECDGATITDVTVGSTASASGDGTNATAGATFPVPEVWEAFTLTECANVTIDFCGSDPLAVALYVNLFTECPIGTSLPAGTVTLIECAGSDSSLSVYFPNLDAGTYYYPVIADVDNYNGFGAYTINFTAESCQPAGPLETCEQSEEVFAPSTTSNTGLTGAGGSQGYAAAWYDFTPTMDGFINVSSCLGGADTRLWIWSGDCDNLVAVADTDDDCAFAPDGTGFAYAASLEGVPVTAGTTYYIEWDARWDASAFDWSIEFYFPDAIDEIALSDFSVYPNPNNGQFSIVNEGVNGNYIIELIDVTGKVVYSEQVQMNSNDRTEINSSNVNTGVYLVKMTNTDENYHRTLRMIIK